MINPWNRNNRAVCKNFPCSHLICITVVYMFGSAKVAQRIHEVLQNRRKTDFVGSLPAGCTLTCFSVEQGAHLFSKPMGHLMFTKYKVWYGCSNVVGTCPCLTLGIAEFRQCFGKKLSSPSAGHFENTEEWETNCRFQSKPLDFSFQIFYYCHL